MRTWTTVIVESTRILEGQPVDLTETLDRLTAAGWTIQTVLPNGVNRWTVIAWKDAA
jgi:hypothetical protein